MSEVSEGKAAGESGAGTNAEVKSFSEAEVKALLEKETAGLKGKVDELLGEKKSVSEKAKAEADRFELEREKQAKENNDFKSLFESSEAKRLEAESRYGELNNKIKTEKRDNSAIKLATEMASGTNAELLSEFIGRRLDVGEDGKVLVLDESGNPTVSTLSDLKKEFVASGKFDSLIDATKASGGGAAKPNTGGAGSGNKKLSEMTRTEKLAYYEAKRSA